MNLSFEYMKEENSKWMNRTIQNLFRYTRISKLGFGVYTCKLDDERKRHAYTFSGAYLE